MPVSRSTFLVASCRCEDQHPATNHLTHTYNILHRSNGHRAVASWFTLRGHVPLTMNYDLFYFMLYLQTQ